MTRGKNLYRVHGLDIRSPWPLPEVAPALDADGPVDIRVRLGAVPDPPVGDGDESTAFEHRGDDACYVSRTIGAFLVKGGREIVVDPAPGAQPAMLRASLLGPALGIALLQRGAFVLHGSAVAVEGRAVAFLGGRGLGKSTMAAAMLDRGHQLLTDDLLTLRADGASPLVTPGYPQLKLWPDALRGLGRRPDELPRLYPGVEKRVLRCPESFLREETRLERIFALFGGPTLAVRSVEPIEAFRLVTSAWFGGRFGPAALALVDRRAHFEACTEVVRKVPMRRCERPHDLEGLDSAARRIEEDLDAV